MTPTREFEETTPTEKCEAEGCAKPAEWRCEVKEHDSYRDPPYAFWTEYFCDEHLPTEARDAIVEWARPQNEEDPATRKA